MMTQFRKEDLRIAVLILVVMSFFFGLLMFSLGMMVGRGDIMKQEEKVQCASCGDFILLSGTMVNDKMMVMTIADWKNVQTAEGAEVWKCRKCLKSKGGK
jgi:hypothetical protein